MFNYKDCIKRKYKKPIYKKCKTNLLKGGYVDRRIMFNLLKIYIVSKNYLYRFTKVPPNYRL